MALATLSVAPVLLNYGQHNAAFGLFTVGAPLLLGSAFYALRRIACPRCKMLWSQHALGEKSVNGWLAWLTTFSECPECGVSACDCSQGWAGPKSNV
jgi:hypothetical protein